MKALLDTHAFLWAALDDPRLSTNARELIEDLPIITIDPVIGQYDVETIW